MFVYKKLNPTTYTSLTFHLLKNPEVLFSKWEIHKYWERISFNGFFWVNIGLGIFLFKVYLHLRLLVKAFHIWLNEDSFNDRSIGWNYLSAHVLLSAILCFGDLLSVYFCSILVLYFQGYFQDSKFNKFLTAYLFFQWLFLDLDITLFSYLCPFLLFFESLPNKKTYSKMKRIKRKDTERRWRNEEEGNGKEGKGSKKGYLLLGLNPHFLISWLIPNVRIYNYKYYYLVIRNLLEELLLQKGIS